MPQPLETASSHDPDLSRQHAAGPRTERQSPAERALAPEGDAPFQSANAVADDGTYVGQAGGYMGGGAPAAESGRAEIEAGSERGEGTYGYPAGPEVGMPGGEHQPGREALVDGAPVPRR